MRQQRQELSGQAEDLTAQVNDTKRRVQALLSDAEVRAQRRGALLDPRNRKDRV